METEETLLRQEALQSAGDVADPLGEIVESSAQPLPIGLPFDAMEEQTLGNTDFQTDLFETHIPAEPSLRIPPRPILRREGSSPANVPPPRQPPPPAPLQPSRDIPSSPWGYNADPNSTTEEIQGTDSLSLGQLRHLVADLPQVEATPYAFDYADAASLPEELEEWFSYDTEEQGRILKSQSTFAQEWAAVNGWIFLESSTFESGSLDWIRADEKDRRSFMQKLVDTVEQKDNEKRLKALESLTYLCLGVWHETAGLTKEDIGGLAAAVEAQKAEDKGDGSAKLDGLKNRFGKSAVQLEWIRTNVLMLLECGGLKTIYDVAREFILRECNVEPIRNDLTTHQREAEARETWCSLTTLYLCIETARTCEDEGRRLELRTAISQLTPTPLLFFCGVLNKLRWDEMIDLSLVKILLATWKIALVTLGGLAEADKARDSFREDHDDDTKTGPMITASPLDYHAFRQEISSKYPAYQPPPPLFPFEPEVKSMLPPLRQNPTKPANGAPVIPSTYHGTSILHQPVHIATPAPSPPPSPAIGKGGKKQNYQTNQLFPFLYPPLDETSNQLGGRGNTNLQDVLVGRKWTGSDIPASILEAAELFSKRMRATRAMKQLWAERVEFLKYERGWADEADEQLKDVDSDDDIPEFDLQARLKELGLEDDESGDELDEKVEVGREVDNTDVKSTLDGSTEERLQTVERFYRDGLPHLQSLVMVLLKTILANVTSLMTSQNGTLANSTQDGPNGSSKEVNGVNGSMEASQVPTEELDVVRSQEITAKAVSGLLVLLLKWFKVSHILKFEYLTQLLVDANYIPMILKLLQTQEIERVVNYRSDKDDLNFFAYCQANSRSGVESSAADTSSHDLSDSDDAAPPPIRRTRQSPPPGQPPPPPAPEVDELGIPVSEMPLEPITTFSWRNFFSGINFLRILQKVCKNKAHRNLMLVTYKSATYLKKALKVPQPELRLYTLKLFKNQVPYCGRKWRQSNMRVITAVYLHCRPELRDDWLCNTDVDADVEQSVPMEQALRALTHWYNLKRYPEQMGATKGILREERDFFVRELEGLDWGEAVEGEEMLEWPQEGGLEGW